MLYCDLAIDNNPIFYGQPCKNAWAVKPSSYFGFVGNLTFLDMQGSSDPFYSGLGSRFVLCYLPSVGDDVIVPLDSIPSQQFDIVLGGQNVTLSIYDRYMIENDGLV
jgi:hypothetical protein